MRFGTIFWGAVLINLIALTVYITLDAGRLAMIAFSLINIVFWVLMRSGLSGFLNTIVGTEERDTTITQKIRVAGNQFQQTTNFILDAKKAIAGIAEIGHEEFTNLLGELRESEIKIPLQEANEKMIALRRKEIESNWITKGIAELTALKHGNDLGTYSYEAISAVVKYLHANQGGFFILKEQDDDKWFELTASYAYDKKKYLEKRVNLGEGLIGQIYYEKEIAYLTDVPEDFVKITSGLGESLPRCICIVPLISEGVIYGAMEIASFNPLEKFELDYLQKISEGIGYNLGSIHSQRKTEKLLKESQEMAQELKTQEEELRQNMEELAATQEQMKRKQGEMDAVLSSLSTVELDLNGIIISANEIFLGITGYKFQEIDGRAYRSLIPQYGNDPIQYEMMWSSIKSGRSFSGEFRILNQDHKEMWMAGNFTPILGDSGLPYKVMVISLFTTQDKEKLFELQELVTAIKNCLPIAELNHDMTFKSANDLFLAELGIKRIELRKVLPQNVLGNGSFGKVEKCLNENEGLPENLDLELLDKAGSRKRYRSTLIKINSNTQRSKRSLLILRNPTTTDG